MVAVRLARTSDADAIADVKRRSWQAAYRGLLPDDVLDELPLVPPPYVWAAAVERGHAPLVAEVAGELVGVAAVGPARDEDAPRGTGELLMIYTLRAVWGSGVGHALHGAAVDRLRGDGHGEAVLWVMEGNERAAAFYVAHGWSPDGAARDQRIGDVVVPTVRMRRTLDVD